MDKQSNLSILQNIQCIPVDDGKSLVYPDQISRTIPKEVVEQVKPYLYELSEYMYSFFPLLKKAGITETVTVDQYVSVLNRIYQLSGSNPLVVGELEAAEYCYKGNI